MGSQGSGKRIDALSWRGALSDASRQVRSMAVALLAAAIVSLSFSQLGFFGVGEQGAYVTYAIVLLAPVALSSLLLGTVLGTLAGLLAGASLLVHSIVQPLDFYEIMFVTPVSSVVLFAVAGFLAGVLFALGLRRDPPVWRRCLIVVVACAALSWLFSFAFRMNVIYELVAQTLPGALSEGEAGGGDAGIVANGLGSFGWQVAIDAALMIVACLAADAAARWERATAGKRSLRTTFRLWLLGGALIAFMVTAGAGFAIVTEQEEASARESMLSESRYLCNQIDERLSRQSALDDAVAAGVIGDEGARALSESLSLDGLLDGYDVAVDGTVVVLAGDRIVLSDDPELPEGGLVSDHFDEESERMLADIAASGSIVQIMSSQAESSGVAGDDPIATQIMYLCAAQTGDHTVVIVRTSGMVFAERSGVMLWTTISAIVLLAVVSVLASVLLARIVGRRIDETNGALVRIEQGDLRTRVHVGGSREFASLSAGINATVDALEGWIAEANARIDRELAAAKTIQEAALPCTFPPFPDILRFDVYASMQPAREVGGDFYDFFLVGGADKGLLGFVIADVSGKSVPAALFMMAAKSHIRGYLEAGMELGEAIENANRKLCEGNGSGMFVTVFAGVLDYRTGRMRCVNAGHNPPFLWSGGAWRLVEERSGLPLGLFDGLPYAAFELSCEIGDELFLYTDGVTEAMDAQGRLFGVNRLKELLDAGFYLHPRSLIDLVRHDLAAFSEDAEQADDITMLALEFGVPPEVSATLVVRADDAELPRVNEFVHTELDRRLCPARAQNQLDIAIEELFVNVAHYAYPNATADDPGSVRISYTYSAEPPSITVELSDDGIPFDPLAKPDAAMPDDILDVPIGGLGILMAKNSVDEMAYERVDGMNVVTIVKRW